MSTVPGVTAELLLRVTRGPRALVVPTRAFDGAHGHRTGA